MIPLSPLATWTIRIVASVALIALMLMAYRWLHTRSRVIAWVFAAGITLRAAAGVTLFLASVFEWPLMPDLQMGGGFWTLALDARSYYNAAAHAVVFGLEAIGDGSASPFYVRALALAMWPFGASPATAVLLNAICYTASVVLLVAAAGLRACSARPAHIPVAIGIAALTFSPAMLIFGTQALKDQLCAMLVIAALAGVRFWSDSLDDPVRRREGLAAGAFLLALSVYGLGGIRAYAAAFFLVSLAVAAVYGLVFAARASRTLRVLLHGVLGVLLWMAFVAGAGSYSYYYRDQVVGVLQLERLAAAFDTSRQGFDATGGATSVAAATAPSPPPRGGGTAPPTAVVSKSEPAPPAGPAVIREAEESRAVRVLRGVAVTLLPVSLLKALSIVDFSGGAGLLWLTDLDTLFIDLTLVVAFYYFVVSIRSGRLSPAALCALVFGVVLLLSMAYVVTNYGTLFRLRLLALAPLWALFSLLPVAMPPTEPSNGARADTA